MNDREQEHLLTKLGWKWYHELNGWRKISNNTIPMFSPGGGATYDELSDGNAREIERFIANTVSEALDDARRYIADDTVTGPDEIEWVSIDAALLAIERARKRVHDD